MEQDFTKRIEDVVRKTLGEETVLPRPKKRTQPEERLPTSKLGPMKVAIGSDHRGYVLKSQLAEYLGELGHTVVDCGVKDGEVGDYPDIALRVADKVARDICDRGVLIDLVGVGSAIAANKINGIRAAPCYDVEAARSSRLHNDANILVLGSSFMNRGLARRVLRIWLETPFEGGRHVKRIEKIGKIEREGLDAGL